ncbi:MAG: GTP-binding protein [Sedimentisphaerales bacterium]
MRDTRYNVTDTIFAVSSPTSDQRVILRISGPDATAICRHLWTGALDLPMVGQAPPYLLSGSVDVDGELKIDVKLYLFVAPQSYTGDDVAEIHIDTSSAVTEVLIESLLRRGLRMAEPGEFTARAFLNDKIDLAQAEAVNEIIVSTNEVQLSAAERLLSGRLGETTAAVCENLVETLSLIEAGLDFSGEGIEFITRDEAVARLAGIRSQLEELLSGSIQYETVVDMPAVGIAGAPNAGKSTLLNKLLGTERSIVSDQRKTTRDVLTGVCQLAHCKCVLFDCAGLIASRKRRDTESILDELAQQAAIEALRHSDVVVFCVDLSKRNWADDVAIRKLIECKTVLPVATKCDLLSEQLLPERTAGLNESFGEDFLPTSVHAGTGIELLRESIDAKLAGQLQIPHASGVTLTARHRQAVTDSISHVRESISELKAGNDEVVALMLRAACQAVSDIRRPVTDHIDERILEQIFNRFCIGK